MNDPRDQLLLRARDAAKLLSISERKLWQLTHDGQVPVVRFGRVVRYDPRDLEQFICAQRRLDNVNTVELEPAHVQVQQ